MHRPGPEAILATYERLGPAWARRRRKSLFERPALERFLAAMPGPRVLDLGCGSGDPLALYLAGRGCRITGVEGARSMVRLFREALPGHRAVHADMRGLRLGERFDAILAFDSVFHLSPDDQRSMMAVFAAHAAPDAALMFTAGPAASEAWGTVEGAAVYHASLSPEEYRARLADAGFAVLDYRPEDPECNRHTIWLARFAGKDGRGG